MFSAKPRPCITRLHRLSLRQSSDLSHLREELTARKLPYIRDYITSIPATLLKSTLSDFNPQISSGYPTNANKLSPGHHLIYFPPRTRLSSLFPDGTDPLHSPGPPFHRRMWAGGSIKFLAPIKTDCSAFHVIEKIVDVKMKGEDADQKIFVTIERRIHRGGSPGELKCHRDWDRDPYIVEERNLVFMRAKLDLHRDTASKVLKPTHSPDLSMTMIPTPALLFRFSALTFNAHAVHLDKMYCHEVEGQRNLLVHGPLTLILMLEVLKSLMLTNRKTEERSERIASVEYRNLAPLYAEEAMKVCVRRRSQESDEGSFDIWIEGQAGGYAVKGLVRTKFDDKPARPSLTGHDRSIKPLSNLPSSEPNSNQTRASTDEIIAKLDAILGPETSSVQEAPMGEGTMLRGEKASANGNVTEEKTVLKRKKASIDKIPAGDEAMPESTQASTDEKATENDTNLDGKAASVDKIPTGDETVPDEESASIDKVKE